ncbi:DNA polymerase III subunit beta [Helicobacter equorum]|uniref:DNA polymerase III subunit beta n=1 Tax=Helicobacter equorum TaxID=361872 RepID=UPI000CF090BD|nr:DNA polymerase III subunit beta [Helicobacter equorum]
MKLSISKTPFEIILSNFQSFLEKRDISQITSHIYFECINDTLILRATDYEVAIQSQIEIQAQEEGKATANGRDILNFIKNLKEGDVTLETQDDLLIIKQGRSKSSLQMFNVHEFPSLPEFSQSQQINIESHKFLSSIKKINSTAETNNAKFELNGAFLDIKEYSINFVATDTRRLAIVKYDTQGINTLSLIIPKRAMNEIQKLFVDNIEIFFNTTYIIIKSPTYLFFSKVINAKYPDYEKIILKSFKNTLKLPKDKFIESIKVVSSLSSKIKITLNTNEILFESISDRNHKASTQIDIQTGMQEEFTFGVDSKNITDFLAQVDSAEFTMALNEQNSPLTLIDNNFSTIIMPIIL